MNNDPGAQAPTIDCRPDGPYLVSGVAVLKNSNGESIPVKPTMALCRCGGSARKPFCDGTHNRNGFSGERQTKGDGPREVYRGRNITILDNRQVCSHAGFCSDNLKEVFRMGSEPWIEPDGAEVQDIISLVHSCPSGALSCEVDGSEVPEPERETAITVSTDGPYYVTGGAALNDPVTGQQPLSPGRYALCRCGLSRNKPFCDGAHWDANFKDDEN